MPNLHTKLSDYNLIFEFIRFPEKTKGEQKIPKKGAKGYKLNPAI